jgi:hypothetical protein
MKCPLCENGNLIRKKIDYSYKDRYFGKYDADVCKIYEESFFTQEASELIEKRAKELSLWGWRRGGYPP